MSLRRDERATALNLIEGYFPGKLSDVKVAAYDEWLGRTPVSIDQIKQALTNLVESGVSKFAPSVFEINEALKAIGALGSAVPGAGDPRTVTKLTQEVRRNIGNLMFVRDQSFGEILRDQRQHYRELVAEHEEFNFPGPNFWRDWLAACDQLLNTEAA